jgi:hypothetical protein
MTDLLYGKSLTEWNRLAGLSGAAAIDIEVTARGHKCGVYRMSKDGTAETGAKVDYDAMTASQRLLWTFDGNAPCCTATERWWASYFAQHRGRKRTVKEVMRDKAIDERNSVLVRGRSPRQLLEELPAKSGWE